MGGMRIVYPVCCGMDVHRDFVVACIATTNSQGVTQFLRKRFSTFTGGLREMAEWLTIHNSKDVCMDFTGKYWFSVHNIFENSFNVVVSHPKHVKAIKGKKTNSME